MTKTQYFTAKELTDFERQHPEFKPYDYEKHPAEVQMHRAYVFSILGLMFVFFFSKLPVLFSAMLAAVVMAKILPRVIYLHTYFLEKKPYRLNLESGDDLMVVSKYFEHGVGVVVERHMVKVLEVTEEGITLDHARYSHSPTHLTWVTFKTWMYPRHLLSHDHPEDQRVYKLLK